MAFKILPHTSELKIEIKSKTKKALFKEAINALAFILGGEKKINKNKKPKVFTVSQKEKNETVLLINLLNKILTSSHIHKKIYFYKKFLVFSPNKIKVLCHGYKINSFKEDLKALTFHQSEIHKDKKHQWKITLIFDI